MPGRPEVYINGRNYRREAPSSLSRQAQESVDAAHASLFEEGGAVEGTVRVGAAEREPGGMEEVDGSITAPSWVVPIREFVRCKRATLDTFCPKVANRGSLSFPMSLFDSFPCGRFVIGKHKVHRSITSL